MKYWVSVTCRGAVQSVPEMKMDRKKLGFASKSTVVLPDSWYHSQLMGNFAFRLLLHKLGNQTVKSSKVSSLTLIATLTEQLHHYLPNYCWTFLLCLLIIWTSARCGTSARKGRFIIQNFNRENQHLPLYVFYLSPSYFIIHRKSRITANQDWDYIMPQSFQWQNPSTGKSLCFELAST